MRLPPKPDESASSWLFRCARAHGESPHGFARWIWGHGVVWTRDADRSLSSDALLQLALRMDVPPQIALGTSLMEYEGRCVGKRVTRGVAPGILALGVYHRTRRRHGQQFCPTCIAEDEEPYYRKRSFLSILFVTACGVGEDRNDYFKHALIDDLVTELRCGPSMLKERQNGACPFFLSVHDGGMEMRWLYPPNHYAMKFLDGVDGDFETHVAIMKIGDSLSSYIGSASNREFSFRQGRLHSIWSSKYADKFDILEANTIADKINNVVYIQHDDCFIYEKTGDQASFIQRLEGKCEWEIEKWAHHEDNLNKEDK